MTINQDSSHDRRDSGGRRHASAVIPLDLCWMSGLHLLSDVVGGKKTHTHKIKKKKITQFGPRCYFNTQLSDVFLFCPCRQNNTLFSHTIMQQLQLLRRGRGGTMTLCIKLERTAPLSLLVMTTWSSTDTVFLAFYFIPLCPCHHLLHHIELWYFPLESVKLFPQIQ